MPFPVGNLVTLNNGWPFGDGPNEWGVRGEVRDGQVHLVCGRCDQSVMPLALALDEPGYAVTGDMLKSRIADHCLKVHAADLGDAILT
jgi:hypothetical protein